MNFVDKLVDRRSISTEISVLGKYGSFKTDIDFINKRILKVYIIRPRNKIYEVKMFRYDATNNSLFIQTYLRYFGEHKFLIKWI